MNFDHIIKWYNQYVNNSLWLHGYGDCKVLLQKKTLPGNAWNHKENIDCKLTMNGKIGPVDLSKNENGWVGLKE